MYALLLMQVSQAKAAISKEQKLKEQLREQMAAAANDSKRQVHSMANTGQGDSLCMTMCVFVTFHACNSRAERLVHASRTATSATAW